MANQKRLDDLSIENAAIIFRNFTGVKKQFNDLGDRNFCLVIDDVAQAQKLAEDGWNVKILPPREEGDLPRHYIPVAVSYDNYPPNIYMVPGPNIPPVRLSEESISALDFAELRNIDVTVNPYSWEYNGKSGVKAYLKTMYVSIIRDQFAEKYASDIHQTPVGYEELPF